MKSLALAAVLLFLPCAASAFDVTACGQTVPIMEEGTLQADLACTGATGVFLDHGAVLDMNGHSIDMLASAAPHIGVQCLGRVCRILSTAATPGAIIGPTGVGSGAGIQSASAVHVSNVSIAGFHYGAYARRVTAVDLDVSGCASYGVFADRARFTDSSFTDCGGGIAVDIKVTARNVIVADNAVLGIDAGQRITGRNIVVSNNGATGIDATVGRNNHVGKISLRDSQVSGHGVDLISARLPILKSSSCETSQRVDAETYAPLGTWGVCSND